MVHVIGTTVYEKLPYHPLHDFAAISLAGFTPSILMATPTLGVTRLAELIERAKARPKQITYGSPGNGSGGHLLGEPSFSWGRTQCRTHSRGG